jgi:hypothetical protein
MLLFEVLLDAVVVVAGLELLELLSFELLLEVIGLELLGLLLVVEPLLVLEVLL